MYDMESSQHEFIDEKGYLCAVEIHDEEHDLVVFESTPKLSFDFRAHKIKIRKSKVTDYKLIYQLKHDRLFLCAVFTRPSFFSRNKQIFGVSPEWFDNHKWALYRVDDIPSSYSGTLKVGKDFDYTHWQHDDKMYPVPFTPEVYQKNGYARFENGILTELFLDEA